MIRVSVRGPRPATAGVSAPTRLPAIGLRWPHVLVAAIVTLLALRFVIVPQLGAALADLPQLPRVPPGWILGGVALEAGSFVAYALFTRGVLPRPGRPGLGRLLRIDVIGSGLTHVLPGGGSAATYFRFQLLRGAEVAASAAALGSIVQGLGSSFALNGLLVLGAALVFVTRGSDGLALLGAALGAAHLLIVGFAWLATGRLEERAVKLAHRVTRRWGDGVRAEALVRDAATRRREVAGDRLLVSRALMWAVANWALDLASLWVFLAAFGGHASFGELLVAFGIAHVISIVPVTPGGLGIVEGTLVPALVHYGTPESSAILAVMSWRLFSFWAPIPLGGVAWLSLRRGPAPPALCSDDLQPAGSGV